MVMKLTRTEALLPVQAVRLLALAVICWLPVVAYLPLWLSLCCSLLWFWYGWLRYRKMPLPAGPGRWLLAFLALSGSLAIAIHFQSVFGRSVGVALLALLLPLKLHETRSRRDGYAVILLSTFMLLGQFIYSQGFFNGLAMLLGVCLLLIALQAMNLPQVALKSQLVLALRLQLVALPLMVVLFLVFPRLQGPLWGLPEDAFSAQSGLSDSMSPGSIAQLSLSTAIAFRADFGQQPVPAMQQRYWRGPVLSRFDGHRWSAQTPVMLAKLPYSVTQKTLDYVVTLEPSNQRWLFVLERPAMIPAAARLTSDLQLLADLPVRSRLRYGAHTLLDSPPDSPFAAQPVWDVHLDEHGLDRLRQLPPTGNLRSRALAQRWAAESHGDSQQIVRRMLDYLRAEPFHYTLRPPLLGADSVDEFLFDSRRGFCEHFAASFVFMMRAAGVPARVITGYQGGEINPNDGTLIVRQSDAHAWAEVWLADQGWQRVDPTAAIAPERIENNLLEALNPDDLRALPLLNPPAWLHAARLQWDALANHWNQWVIGYNQARQRSLFESFGVNFGDVRQLGLLFSALGSGLIMLALFWSLRGSSSIDPVERSWQLFCRKQARHGLQREPWEGPQAYGERCAMAWLARAEIYLQALQKAEETRTIAGLYAQLRYANTAAADASTASDQAGHGQLLREFKQRIKNF